MRVNYVLSYALFISSTVAFTELYTNFLQPKPSHVKEHTIDTKYFHEPGGSNELEHYDIRFFISPLSSHERLRALKHLIQSYLTVFNDRKIETWIAHGTLLGWWWNGKIMPWDWDLDTQVTVTTLNWLAVNMNMSSHRHYMIDDEGNSVGGNFLLDVNPNHIDRLRGSGNNVIDARWIDVHSGLYIDITGVSKIEDDPDSDLWGGKDFHRYHSHELYPLRTSIFEGVMAKVPFMFESILTKEYSAKALSNTEYAGHRWDPNKQAWIKQSVKAQENTSNSTVQA